MRKAISSAEIFIMLILFSVIITSINAINLTAEGSPNDPSDSRLNQGPKKEAICL